MLANILIVAGAVLIAIGLVGLVLRLVRGRAGEDEEEAPEPPPEP